MIRKIKPEHEEKMEKSKLKEILDRHEEVFAQKLGHMPIKAHLNLKEGTRPVWKKAQPVPHALYPLVDAELERWIKEGIAEPVEASNNSGWATPLVVVPKADGWVRLAADYRVTVNPQLETVKYPLPSPEELFARIRGKKICKVGFKGRLPAN